ncbi:MAG: hypothetical protein HZA93_13230 [Verrucomicrobia bacterium]|nr:hypothetical protein [Verrucomicrobiota bacterium]
MNPRILNREGKLPSDGWYNIEANGEHINHRARVIQVIDAKAVTSIVNRFSQEAAVEHFAGQRIDKDHLSQSEDNSTESLGWAMELRNRDGLLEAKIDWTGLGLPLIESAPGKPPVYKFFSTEYEPAECEPIGTRKIKNRTYDVVRPLRLDGLSLTNDPNNRGQRPISNRNPAATAEREENQTTMKTLLKKMGLAEDASEESAVAAYDKIANRATTAESQVTTLTAERDALLKDQVESDLAKYQNRIKPDNVEKVRKQLISNRAATIELLESLSDEAGGAGGGEDREKKPITNRREARTPAGGGGGDKAAEAEEERAAKIQNRARALRSADKSLSISRSYELAEAEFPAPAAK